MFQELHKMKNYLLLTMFMTALMLCLSGNLLAQQNRPIGIPDYDPKVFGFGFNNYGGDKAEGDLGVDDMIRLHGAKAVCTSGTTARDCKLDAAARKWLEGSMKTIVKGRCTGMAVASLRFMDGAAFKGLSDVTQFDPGARSVYSLGLLPVKNYIAYYWLTQVFREVANKRAETENWPPVKIAETLKQAFETGNGRYTMAIFRFEQKGNARRRYDGHEFLPYAVEDLGTLYRIYIYDNNYRGVTRYLYIRKADNVWWYSSAPVQNDKKPEYLGNASTGTLSITANSWRENQCFDPMFGYDGPKQTGCNAATAGINMQNGGVFQKAGFKKQQSDDDDGEEDAQFFLTGDGDMMVIDDGRRVGYDPRDGIYYDDVPDAIDDEILGGLGHNIPNILLPYDRNGDDYTIYFSGKYLDRESTMDFVFSAPGFTVGFDGIRLDPGEKLVAHVSRNGQRIKFETSQKDGETPTVYYAFDSTDGNGYSYVTEVGGESLSTGQWVQMNFDFANGKLYFADNDGNEDAYNIELIRIAPDGNEEIYAQNGLQMQGNDSYEMDFGTWEGEGEPMCFRDDDDRDGDFRDEGPCEEQDDEPEPPDNTP